ncbi:MAG: ribosome biogenesis GTPase Der [Candidatus Symbiodolus clandestinus]
MTPVVALVGRPNVGKSTLFNAITHSRAALVADFPGLTRDRLYGSAEWFGRFLMVIDTGGLEEQAAIQGVDVQMAWQAQQAIQEADLILLVVDGRVGLTAADRSIAQSLQRQHKPFLLVVNKVEGLDSAIATADFYRLGSDIPLLATSAAHQQGISTLMQATINSLPAVPDTLSPDNEPESPAAVNTTGLATEADEGIATTRSCLLKGSAQKPIQLAIVGRPNVGKSSLTNALLGEERVIVYDLPGTTRDSVMISLEHQGTHYAIIDTAGVRRRSRVEEIIEKFSIVKTLQAIEQAQVVFLVLDASQGISDQDCSLLRFVLERGRALVIVVNKWDALSKSDKLQLRQQLERRLAFINFARIHYISALKGQGVGRLFASVAEAYASAMRPMATRELNRILQQAQSDHLPPRVRGRRVKLKFAHLGGHNPPTVVIHGNQVEALPEAYRRYLSNYYRQALSLVGTPIALQFKQGDNPYAGKRNALTLAQQRRRQRLIRHRKQHTR